MHYFFLLSPLIDSESIQNGPYLQEKDVSLEENIAQKMPLSPFKLPSDSGNSDEEQVLGKRFKMPIIINKALQTDDDNISQGNKESFSTDMNISKLKKFSKDKEKKNLFKQGEINIQNIDSFSESQLHDNDTCRKIIDNLKQLLY